MTAARTEAIELEAVGLNGKTVPQCHFFLKMLNVAVLELHDLSAACANEMVMMALMRHIVVLRLSAEVPGLGQTRLAEEIQRAVNGRESEVRIFARQMVVHLFSRDVFLLQKGIKDQLTLPRKFKLVLPKMLLQDSYFFGIFGHREQPEPPSSELKTKLSARSRGSPSNRYQSPLTFDGCVPGCL